MIAVAHPNATTAWTELTDEMMHPRSVVLSRFCQELFAVMCNIVVYIAQHRFLLLGDLNWKILQSVLSIVIKFSLSSERRGSNWKDVSRNTTQKISSRRF